MFDVSTTDTTSASSPLETHVYKTITDINASQLNNLVTQSDGGTLFHRYEWLVAVEESLSSDPRHILTTKDGNPVGFLPNFVTDLPLPDELKDRAMNSLPLKVVEPPPPGYGGPIMTGNKRANLNQLFDHDRLTDGFKTVLHRVHTFDIDAIEYGRYLEAHGYTPRMTECTFFIDLRNDWETIHSNMDSGRRRSMRNALQQDYTVEMIELGDELDQTYDQYVSNMERVNGKILPKAFFEALASRFSERVRVFKATVEDKEVGRYIHLLDEESTVLHHWLSAIGTSANFDYYPSELLHHRAIQWGSEEGFNRYSFGPTNPHYSDSVFKFKEKYGGTPLPALRWERGTLPGVWQIYELSRSWYRNSQISVH